jgi:ribosomal protein S18
LEKNFKDNIISKDEIWLMDLLYALKWVQVNDKAYFYSYYLQLETANVKDIKQLFLYNNIILKYDIFRRTKKQSTFEFKNLQKELTTIIDSWEEKKLGQKISFFADLKNSKYVNWKSIPMFKKYITRFGDIKPRKYTHNWVSTQKKLRKEIIRARNFGLVEFIK